MTRNEIIEKMNKMLNNDVELKYDVAMEIEAYLGDVTGWSQYRVFDIEQMNDLYCNCTPLEVLQACNDINYSKHNYFYIDDIYGVTGLVHKEDIYDMVDYIDNDDIIDYIIDYYNQIDLSLTDSDFDELAEALFNEDYDEE